MARTINSTPLPTQDELRRRREAYMAKGRKDRYVPLSATISVASSAAYVLRLAPYPAKYMEAALDND